MNSKTGVLWICLVLVTKLADGQSGGDVVVPNSLQTVDGNSGSHWPWASGPIRYQQVYDASQFQQLANTGGSWIENISYRLDGNDIGDFARTINDVVITLSTTQREPDALSALFADNTGPDGTVVFSGSIFLHMERPYPQGFAQPFGSPIFITPFFYNPNQGNLLMDIQIFSESPIFLPSDLDSSRVFGDSVSRVVGAINSQSGFTVDTDGLVTRFIVEPIPEPSVLTLCAIGVGGGLFLRSRRRWR